MSIVPTFASFGKTSIFNLYTDPKDPLDNKLRSVHKTGSPNGLTVDASIIYADKAKPRGELKASATRTCGPLKGALLEGVVQTDRSKASSLGIKAKNVFPNRLPGFNLAFKETTSERDFGEARYGLFAGLDADYSRSNFTATGAVTTDGDSNHSLAASAAVGFEGFSVGGDVKFLKAGEKPFAPKSYNAGVSYRSGAYTASAVTDAMFDKVKLSLIAKQPQGHANWQEVGLQAKVDLPSANGKAQQRDLIFGARYQASANTFYNGAIVLNNGSGAFGVEHRFAEPKLSVSATAQFQAPATAFSPWPVTKYGVGITCGDY
jgi:hypothetical protein